MSILDKACNIYSQAGQDGMIAYIFNKLNIQKGHFVEFGAWDGIHLSNCRNLFSQGWSGVFIESDEDKYKQLVENYKQYDHIECINAFITDNFDEIYGWYRPSIDFLSIDVDGPDLEVFETILYNRPKVACIEGGIAAYPYERRRSRVDKVGQSLWVIKEVVESMGYKVLCQFQDVIVIKEEYAGLFDTTNDIMAIWLDGVKHTPYRTIPMHLNRLKRVGRYNRMLDYIMYKTDYDNYGDEFRSDWVKDKSSEIDQLLNIFL